MIKRFVSPQRFFLLLAACLSLVVAACASGKARSDSLRLSGVIEGTQAVVASEIGGRVVEVKVDEGDEVQAGQVVARLDDAAMQAQVRQAQAGLSAARAMLAQARAGARSEEIAAARAALAQAQAERDGAELAYQNAAAILNNPQQLLAQLDAARTGVKLAEQNVAAAAIRFDQAKWWREFYADDKSRRKALDAQVLAAQRELEAAQAQLAGAKAQVSALEEMRSAPVTIQAQVNSARSAYSMTLASVAVAEAALAELEAGPLPQDVALAEARVQKAQAQLELAQAHLARAELRAPLAGIVASRSVRAGEMAQPGVALLTIRKLDPVTMVVYVPQEHLPRIKLGAPAQVYVDAYPDEAFQGRVTWIARQAQFSSRDTQSREDRANVVFGVEIRLPNADQRLKAGMTAEAVIELP